MTMIEWPRTSCKNQLLAYLMVAAGAVVGVLMYLAVSAGNGWGFDEQTFWNWTELLIIPVVLGSGFLLFNRALLYMHGQLSVVVRLIDAPGV